jgi:hypothetical protein
VLRDAVDAMWCTLANAPLDRAAASEMMRVYALAGYSPTQTFIPGIDRSIANTLRSRSIHVIGAVGAGGSC